MTEFEYNGTIYRPPMEAGYQIIVPPSKVNLQLKKTELTDFPLEYAYCVGPVGEVIEFYDDQLKG